MYMHGHCTKMLMWYSLLLLVPITVINVCSLHVKFLCKCLQTCEILKNTRQEIQNTRVSCAHVLQA